MYPELHRPTAAHLRLEVEGKESMENVVGQKSQQQKALDGPGVMTIDVVRVPVVGQFIESVVFNVPAQVRQAHHLLGSRLRYRQGR